MTEIVNGPTGLPAVVNFGEDHGHHGHHGHHGSYGISDKDHQFIEAIEHGKQTREVLKDVREAACATELSFREVFERICEVKRDVAETKATVLAVDAQRVRDQLALLQTQFLIVTGGLSPAGASVSAPARARE